MKILHTVAVATAAFLCLYIPHLAASSDAEKVAGFYISRTPYASTSIGGETVSSNEQALVFHPDGTMTRNDANAWQGWGTKGKGNGGLFFDPPINGVWEVIHEKKCVIVCKAPKKIRVRAVLFQYSPSSDYPPPSSGIVNFFTPTSENLIIRRCWEFEFSHLKNGKFQKCVGTSSSAAVIAPNQDPLSTEIPQGLVTLGSASGPLPVFSRVNLEKAWFKAFP